MAEDTAPQGDAPVEGEKQTTEIDWKAEARKWESRAKENLASAKANEGAAKRLAEIEEANKSELQKAQEALDEIRGELESTRLSAMRAEVANEHGIPSGLLSGSTREELESHAAALIAFRGEQEPERLIVPSEGGSPSLALNGDGLESALRTALGIN